MASPTSTSRAQSCCPNTMKAKAVRYFCVNRRVLVGSSVPAGRTEACEGTQFGLSKMTCDLRQELQSSEQDWTLLRVVLFEIVLYRSACRSKATCRISSFTDDDHWNVDPRHKFWGYRWCRRGRALHPVHPLCQQGRFQNTQYSIGFGSNKETEFAPEGMSSK